MIKVFHSRRDRTSNWFIRSITFEYLMFVSFEARLPVTFTDFAEILVLKYNLMAVLQQFLTIRLLLSISVFF